MSLAVILIYNCFRKCLLCLFIFVGTVQISLLRFDPFLVVGLLYTHVVNFMK